MTTEEYEAVLKAYTALESIVNQHKDHGKYNGFQGANLPLETTKNYIQRHVAGVGWVDVDD